MTEEKQEKLKKVILIVEDDEMINMAYKKSLEEAGFETIFSANGEQGCELVKMHKPNLILLDIMLHGKKNGFDFLTTVKSDDETKSVPIFVMTNLDNTHEKEALEMGADKFYVKANTSLTELIQEIKKFT